MFLLSHHQLHAKKRAIAVDSNGWKHSNVIGPTLILIQGLFLSHSIHFGYWHKKH